MPTLICVIISNGGDQQLPFFSFLFFTKHRILHRKKWPTQRQPAINKNNRSPSKVKQRLGMAKNSHLFMLYRHCQRNAAALKKKKKPFLPVEQRKGNNCNWWRHASLKCMDNSTSPYVSCQPPVSFLARSLILICIRKSPRGRSSCGWINFSTPETSLNPLLFLTSASNNPSTAH